MTAGRRGHAAGGHMDMSGQAGNAEGGGEGRDAARALGTAPATFMCGVAAEYAAPVLQELQRMRRVHGDWLVARLRAALHDRYDIEREIGHGGMAVVYRARDRRFHRDVAIKVLREDGSRLASAERFAQEIALVSRLQHPHIVPLYDSGDVDGLHYFVMPCVEGETLRERLQREGALPLAEVVRIVGEVGEALAYAHARGVVHRDIKPGNILLQSGQPMLADSASRWR